MHNHSRLDSASQALLKANALLRERASPTKSRDHGTLRSRATPDIRFSSGRDPGSSNSSQSSISIDSEDFGASDSDDEELHAYLTALKKKSSAADAALKNPVSTVKVSTSTRNSSNQDGRKRSSYLKKSPKLLSIESLDNATGTTTSKVQSRESLAKTLNIRTDKFVEEEFSVVETEASANPTKFRLASTPQPKSDKSPIDTSLLELNSSEMASTASEPSVGPESPVESTMLSEQDIEKAESDEELNNLISTTKELLISRNHSISEQPVRDSVPSSSFAQTTSPGKNLDDYNTLKQNMLTAEKIAKPNVVHEDERAESIIEEIESDYSDFPSKISDLMVVEDLSTENIPNKEARKQNSKLEVSVQPERKQSGMLNKSDQNMIEDIGTEIKSTMDPSKPSVENQERKAYVTNSVKRPSSMPVPPVISENGEINQKSLDNEDTNKCGKNQTCCCQHNGNAPPLNFPTHWPYPISPYFAFPMPPYYQTPQSMQHSIPVQTQFTNADSNPYTPFRTTHERNKQSDQCNHTCGCRPVVAERKREPNFGDSRFNHERHPSQVFSTGANDEAKPGDKKSDSKDSNKSAHSEVHLQSMLHDFEGASASVLAHFAPSSLAVNAMLQNHLAMIQQFSRLNERLLAEERYGQMEYTTLAGTKEVSAISTQARHKAVMKEIERVRNERLLRQQSFERQVRKEAAKRN
ncbi:hypothetical protein HDU83_005143 [Entophlyctis luteolus]|nr:hypothetical protein HDU83_005143 [Entophlyctis luteolus]